MEGKKNLLMTSSPHLHEGSSTSRIMWTVTACLVPAGAWGVYNFGLTSLWIILVSVGAAVLTEWVITKLLKKEQSISDGSAVLTGLLVSFNMPPSIPAFIPILASVFAIGIVKHTFGGLGRNWMNPALAGRVFAMFSWTGEMTTWSAPVIGAGADAFTGATPLAQGASEFLSKQSYWDLFIGNISGCIGEVSALLLLLGAAYLFIRKIITWQIPLSYAASFLLLVWIFGGTVSGSGYFTGDILFHFLAGGLVLGAFFMATDMVTSPLTSKGMIIYGIGCGLLTFLIRIYGGFPEGVSLGIILMNIFVPLIDRFTKPVKFGNVKEVKNV
ncbi:MAG: RnfABCDGE type electron transport complex subunit D [Spirochaetales bacterium]|nr:RnfABCDGE type electron transport complex subunit D [Spirochaetales bacterium]